MFLQLLSFAVTQYRTVVSEANSKRANNCNHKTGSAMLNNRLAALKQEKQSLAAHGLSEGNCKAVSYSVFRQFMSDISTPLVSSQKGTTFIFNQQKNVCALVKPPYFDAQGQCQPVRYFLVENVQLTAFSKQGQFELYAKLLSTQFQSRLKQIKVQLQLSAKSSLKRQSEFATKRKPAPVWTTMRLTA